MFTWLAKFLERSPQASAPDARRRDAEVTRPRKEADFREREQRVWDVLRRRLKGATTFDEANAIVDDPHAPGSGEPGGLYCSNLGFFLTHLIVPRDSESKERMWYIALLERIRENYSPDGADMLRTIDAAIAASRSRRTRCARCRCPDT